MHRLGDLHLDWRKVPDALDAGIDEQVGHALRKGSRHRDDANLDVALLDDGLEAADILHLDVVDRAADDVRVLVEERDEVKAERHEVLVVRERDAEMADADDRDIPVVVEAEDAADVALELIDVVTDALLAELAEGREILAICSGVMPRRRPSSSDEMMSRPSSCSRRSVRK